MRECLGIGLPFEDMAVESIRKSIEDAKSQEKSCTEEPLDFPAEIPPPGWKDTLLFTMVPIVGLTQLVKNGIPSRIRKLFR